MKNLATSVLIILWLTFSGCEMYRYGWLTFRDNFLKNNPSYTPSNIPTPKQWPDTEITVCWVGHATVLLNIYGTTILTDPVLVNRIAPPHLAKGINLGVKRINKLPLFFEDLPHIDLVLLSHAHYDHWDLATLKHFDSTTTFIIPRNTEELLPKRLGNFKVLDWGDSLQFGDLGIRSSQAVHWGGLHPTKREKKADRGYNIYTLTIKDKKILFAGDSGFKKKNTGETDWNKKIPPGPYDLCILPIGDYADYYDPVYHMSPEEAWEVFSQLQGTWLLPIHWRTFILTRVKEIPPLEPGARLFRAAQKDSTRIPIKAPGETFVLP